MLQQSAYRFNGRPVIYIEWFLVVQKSNKWKAEERAKVKKLAVGTALSIGTVVLNLVTRGE